MRFVDIQSHLQEAGMDFEELPQTSSFMWKSLRELCDPTTFPNPDQWPLSNPEGRYILTLINSGDINAPAHLIAVGITRGRSGWQTHGRWSPARSAHGSREVDA